MQPGARQSSPLDLDAGLQQNATDDAHLLERLEQLADRPMNARQAAEFLGMGEDGFKKIAKDLPRCRLSEQRYVYLRSDLLAFLRARREAPVWFHRQAG